MTDQDHQLLKSLRKDLRETLRASERCNDTVTDQERLDELTFQLARTLHTLDHQMQARNHR